MGSLCNQAADFAVSIGGAVGGTRRTGGAFLPPVTVSYNLHCRKKKRPEKEEEAWEKQGENAK